MAKLVVALPWTEEDEYIWRRVCLLRFHVPPRINVCAAGAALVIDRRDANIMLQLTSFDYWERDHTQDRCRRCATAQRWVRNKL